MKHKIVILVGQSGSGKSAIYKQLVKRGYKGLITNTTRPMREGETNGKDYNFLSKDQFDNLIAEGQMVEYRRYNMVLWFKRRAS